MGRQRPRLSSAAAHNRRDGAVAEPKRFQPRIGSKAIGVIGPYRAPSKVTFEGPAFAPLEAEREDPVAGSLNAAVGEWLIGTGRAPDSYITPQGTAMGGEAGSMSPRLMARSGPAATQ
jgi:predicted PhzF superfamily epimerase YddE/YHI9